MEGKIWNSWHAQVCRKKYICTKKVIKRKMHSTNRLLLKSKLLQRTRYIKLQVGRQTHSWNGMQRCARLYQAAILLCNRVYMN